MLTHRVCWAEAAQVLASIGTCGSQEKVWAAPGKTNSLLGLCESMDEGRLAGLGHIYLQELGLEVGLAGPGNTAASVDQCQDSHQDLGWEWDWCKN